jgi:hypothetical protein
MESILKTKADATGDFLRGLAGSVHVTFEEGTQAAWLYDGVKPLVAEVIVCNPRENKWLAVGNKGDQVDAHKLAQLLRGGQLKPVYHVGAAAQRGCTSLDLHGLNACVQGARIGPKDPTSDTTKRRVRQRGNSKLEWQTEWFLCSRLSEGKLGSSSVTAVESAARNQAGLGLS